MMRATGVTTALVCIGVGLVSAGCGSGSGASGGASGPVARSSPKPGSPEAVVRAAGDALAAGDNAALCHYLPPAAQKRCATGAPHTFTISGLGLGNSAVLGDRALVVVVADRVCVLQTPCASNHDPNVGLPNAQVSFDDAFQRSLTGKAFFTASLTKISGKWYVDELLYRA
jgi:hypothetical protein